MSIVLAYTSNFGVYTAEPCGSLLCPDSKKTVHVHFCIDKPSFVCGHGRLLYSFDEQIAFGYSNVLSMNNIMRLSMTILKYYIVVLLRHSLVRTTV